MVIPTILFIEHLVAFDNDGEALNPVFFNNLSL